MYDPLYTNSTTPDYGYLEPVKTRTLPFPLENTEEAFVTAANALDSIQRKLTHCKAYNGLNEDEPRKKHINAMLYKIRSILILMQGLSRDLNEMYL